MKWLIGLLKSRRLLITLGFIFLMILVIAAGIWFNLALNTILLGVVVVMFLWILMVMYQRMQANQGAAALEQSIKAQAEQQLLGVRPDKREEIEQLKQQLNEAIETLKTSKLGKGRRGKAALYALPWYVFLGPPAAGKTTAIVNSGLEFPFGSDRIRGVGGTRNCDWFFSNSAIILDTAGRYTTEDEDREEWLAFLDTLKKYRGHMPINGALVGISIADLINATPDEVEWHASNIRNRIDELIQKLGVNFPVYLVFTKCDLIQGFVEFFEEMNRVEREQVWGCTFTREQQENENPRAVFESEFRLLLDALTDSRLARLNSPMKREIRQKVYVFPLELETVQDNLAQFVGKLFHPNPYSESPVFRGFYFTSGTQEGVPIDRVIQNIAHQFDLSVDTMGQFNPEVETKSYFIKDLFTDLVIPDQQMVTRTSRAANQKNFLRLAVAGASVLLLALFILGTSQAYLRSKFSLNEIRNSAEALQKINWTSDNSLLSDFKLLDQFGKQLEDVEYKDEHPSLLNFGLSRTGSVVEPARGLYFRKAGGFIDNYLYKELERRMVNPGRYSREQIYNYLKAYLLMGSEVARLDTAGQKFLKRELNTVLDERFFQFMRPDDAKELQPLIERQVAYFVNALGKQGVPGFKSDVNLVSRVRNSIYEAPSIQGVYMRLKREAIDKLQPLTLEQMLHGQYANMMTSGYEIPGFFTQAGWQSYVKDAFHSESEHPDREDWVTGIKQQKLPPDMRDPDKMEAELKKSYYRDYIEVWWQFLRSINYKSFGSLAEVAQNLKILGDVVNSPLATLVNTASDETTFESAVSSGIREKAGGLVGSVGKKLGISGGDTAGKIASTHNPVDAQFSFLHSMSTTASGNNANANMMTNILNQLTTVSDALTAMSNDPATQSKEYAAKVLQQGAGELPDALRAVRGSMGGLDLQTRRALFEQPLQFTWSAILGAAQQSLNNQWESQVYEPFKTTLANYYPFNRNGQDASVVDVERFFQPESGTLWSFYNGELKTFIKQGSWRSFTWEGRGIRISSALANTLDKATSLQKAFFFRGAMQADFSMQPGLPVGKDLDSAAPVVEQVCLTIDGKQDCYRMGRQYWTDFIWPGTEGAPGAQLKLLTRSGTTDPVQYDGSWGFFRLLEKARIQKISSSLYKLQWTIQDGHNYEVFVNYELRANSAYNPFGNAREFFAFTCPDRLN